MRLAIVRGHVTATVKDASLGGRRLALVQPVDETGASTGSLEVALDVTAAAAGQTVLVARGSAARLLAETRQVATDLAVVAIVDEVTVSGTPARGAQPSPATPRNRKKTGGA